MKIKISRVTLQKGGRKSVLAEVCLFVAKLDEFLGSYRYILVYTTATKVHTQTEPELISNELIGTAVSMSTYRCSCHRILEQYAYKIVWPDQYFIHKID